MWTDPFREALSNPRTPQGAIFAWKVLLSSEGSLIRPEPYQRAMAFLSERLLATLGTVDGPRTIFFLVPEAKDELARHIVLALLFADFVHRHNTEIDNPIIHDKGGLLRHGNVILLVTQQISRAKSFLKGLKIADMDLADFWEISRLTGRTIISGNHPCVQIANPGWLVDGLPTLNLGAVVVDASHPRTLNLIEKVLRQVEGVVRIIVAPPVPQRLEGFEREGAMIWLWDPEAQADLCELSGFSVGSVGTQAQRTVWVVPDAPRLDRSLYNVYERLLRSIKEVRWREPLSFPWTVYHRLRQLSVPLLEVEKTRAMAFRTLTLKDSIRLIKDHVPTGDPYLEAAWLGIAEALEEAYATLLRLQEPPKFWAIAERIEDHLLTRMGEPLRIVVPTEHEATLLTGLMGQIISGWENALKESRIELVTLNREASLVATGRTARTLLLGHRTGRTRYLDYCPSYPVEVLAYPYEAKVERASLERLYNALDRFRFPEVRAQILAKVGLSFTHADESNPLELRPLLSMRDTSGHLVDMARLVVAKDVENIDFDELLTHIDWTSEIPLPAERPAVPDNVDLGGIFNVEVEFDDGSMIIYPAGHSVDIWYREAIQRISALDLRRGHRVVVLVDDVYGHLFERFLDVLNEYRIPSEIGIVELWRRAKRELLRHHESISSLYRALAAQGLGVDYQAVVGWYRDGEEEILAPLRFRDFCILATAAGLGSDEQSLQGVFKYIRRERAIRRVAGKHLRELIRGIAVGAEKETAERAAKDIGVSLAEIYSATDLRTVTEVHKRERTTIMGG